MDSGSSGSNSNDTKDTATCNTRCTTCANNGTSTKTSGNSSRSFRRLSHDDDNHDNNPQQPSDVDEENNKNASSSCCCLDCHTRLFRISDNVMVTSDNRKTIIPGRLYNQVNNVTHQMVLAWLEREFGMQRIDLFYDDTTTEPVQALVSPLRFETERQNHDQDKENHHENSTCTTTGAQKQPTLLIVTGRGFCRAGILSTRHTVESGVEVGSALHPILMALERDMTVVCLDPNARGNIQGLDTLFRSLASPVLAPYLQDRPIYILAHSAAGGYLVQYLLQQTPEREKATTLPIVQPQQQPTTARNIKLKTPLITLHPPFYVTLPQIQAMVLTDSTHHLEWLSLKDRPDVVDFLQSPICLYIRNTQDDFFAPHARGKQAGDPMDRPSPAWIKRFGTIRTVYAGTPDHSLMCYTARHVIWEFMDQQRQRQQLLQQQQQQQRSLLLLQQQQEEENKQQQQQQKQQLIEQEQPLGQHGGEENENKEVVIIQKQQQKDSSDRPETSERCMSASGMEAKNQYSSSIVDSDKQAILGQC